MLPLSERKKSDIQLEKYSQYISGVIGQMSSDQYIRTKMRNHKKYVQQSGKPTSQFVKVVEASELVESELGKLKEQMLEIASEHKNRRERITSIKC